VLATCSWFQPSAMNRTQKGGSHLSIRLSIQPRPSGEYNTRRAECEAGVRHLSKYLPKIRALRDVTLDELKQYGKDLPEVIYRRCRHVISENARVILAAEALERRDLEAFGHLMRESHRSLRDDYEVSCPELDIMVELAEKVEGVYGARMTGGGFGGCTVNLVDKGASEDLRAASFEGYGARFGFEPDFYVLQASDGTSEITPRGFVRSPTD